MNSSMGPCRMCNSETAHISGICRDCRLVKCKRCERKFDTRARNVMFCSECQKYAAGKKRIKMDKENQNYLTQWGDTNV